MLKNLYEVKINDGILQIVELYIFKLFEQGVDFTVQDIINEALLEYLTEQLFHYHYLRTKEE